MQLTPFEIEGPKLISQALHRDERGFFCERFRRDLFAEAGFAADSFVQDNFSRSAPGVLRGLHAQHREPQGKLVTCLSGRIFDVAVDLRMGSPTLGRAVTAVLTGEEPQWLWIPAGFAHGFCVLGDAAADVLYKVDRTYDAGGEIGVVWNDPDLAIEWPIAIAPILSQKDRVLPSFAAYRADPRF